MGGNMTKNDFKKVTKEWLLTKRFQKKKETEYLCMLKDFDVSISFDKNRFSEKYHVHIGFRLKDLSTGWGHAMVVIPNEKYWKHIKMADGSITVDDSSFYYEEWEREEYLECLEKVYEIYIKPYFDLGVKYLKALAKDPFLNGNPYFNQSFVHPNAVEVIFKM